MFEGWKWNRKAPERAFAVCLLVNVLLARAESQLNVLNHFSIPTFVCHVSPYVHFGIYH